ncbi:MAG: hypothetical protein ACI84O_001116 [Myxococcota bacterium]|jgi:hypothetical protein
MLFAACLIAVLGCASSQTEDSLQQFEDISKQAMGVLKTNGHAIIRADFTEVFADSSTRVMRANSAAEFWFNTGKGHTKYKIVGVSKTASGYATKVIMLSHYKLQEKNVQQNANLLINWIAKPQLMMGLVKVLDCEQLTSEHTLFEDVSNSTLQNINYAGQLAPSLNFWQKHIPSSLGISTKSHQGVAIADVDNNGLDDIYLPQPAGLPNKLLLQVSSGVFEDYSSSAGLDFFEASRSALFLDLDNDNDLDLISAFPGSLVVFANDGNGVFTIAATIQAPEATSLAAADYNGDGLLDIYVCRYLNPYENQVVPQPYDDANNGLDNFLMHNLGDLQFKDVTTEVGLAVNNMRFSFAASFEDYDNDGDQDLYVANDYGRNNLYRNDQGKFTDVAAAAGVEDISAGMAVSWADYDNDGNIDLYVSNMYSSAGQRITYQRDFMQSASAATRSQMQRHAGGNTLFKNMGDGTFKDVSQRSKTSMGRWAWGSIFFDYNNDTLADIFVPNGFTTNDENDDL